MSKRNFILLVLVLTLIVGFVLLYFYFNRPTGTGTGGGTDDNFISNFNPFGTSKTVNPKPDDTANPDTDDNTNTETPDTSGVRLIKVSSMPIAGYGVYMKERYKEVEMPQPADPEQTASTKPPAPTAPATEFVPALRYVDRATGNIFQTFADKIDERKFSSTTIPKVYEAFFGNKGQSVIMRYLKADDRTIETFAGNLPKELLGGDGNNQNEIKGTFLPENITDMSISADTLKTFYLFNANPNSATGISATFAGDAKTQVFDSPFTEWLSQYPNSNLITLTTKPSAQVPGYMYAVNPSTKSLVRVMGGINGLTTLTSPSGKLVLYADNNLSLGIYNIESRESSPIALKTLPDKCVWASSSDSIYCAVPRATLSGGMYPDVWYRGELSFSDVIWKIDTVSGNTAVVIDPGNTGDKQDIDGIKLTLDDTGSYLFFVNKKDSYLWQAVLE